MPGAAGGGHHGGGGIGGGHSGGFGGGSHGGSFGGGRSGGFGGGARPTGGRSGGFGGGPRPTGGFGGGPRAPRPPMGGMGMPPMGGRPPRRRAGCLTPVISVFCILFILFVFVNIVSGFAVLNRVEQWFGGGSSDSAVAYDVNNINNEYAAVIDNLPDGALTVYREKLDSDYCEPIDGWYRDDAGVFEYASEDMQVQSALQTFYDATGVQPYLYVTDNLDGNYSPDYTDVDNFLYDMYMELFPDEGHYIVLFFLYDDDSYDTFYITGDDAVTVIDDMASEILLDYIDQYYQSSETYGDMFANAFADAAEAIMTDTSADVTVIPSVNEDNAVIVSSDDMQKTEENTKSKQIAWVCFGGVAMVILFVIVIRWRKSKEQELEEDSTGTTGTSQVN